MCHDDTAPVPAHFAADRSAAGGQQCVHDLCLVRASQEPGHGTLVRGGPGELGYCAVRVPVAGSGQSHRVHPVQRRAAQDPAGSHHPDGVCPLCGVLPQPAPQMGLPLGGLVHGGGGVLHFSGCLRQVIAWRVCTRVVHHSG